MAQCNKNNERRTSGLNYASKTDEKGSNELNYVEESLLPSLGWTAKVTIESCITNNITYTTDFDFKSEMKFHCAFFIKVLKQFNKLIFQRFAHAIVRLALSWECSW